MLGYTRRSGRPEDCGGSGLHTDDRERVLASDERFEARGEPVDEEYRLLAKDGAVVWVREETVLVRDEAGEPQFVQGIMSDVTEKKRTRKRLHHLALHDTSRPPEPQVVRGPPRACPQTKPARQGNRVAVLSWTSSTSRSSTIPSDTDVGICSSRSWPSASSAALRPEDTSPVFGGDEFVCCSEAVDGPRGGRPGGRAHTEELRSAVRLGRRQLYAAASIGVSVGHT
jgi:PAS domain S-box-containing protein